MLAEYIQLPGEGDTIGPYLIRKSLSASILGSFYIATHQSFHKNVLLHIIPEALLRADTRFHQRYKEAIERLKRVEDDSVLKPKELSRISGHLVVQYDGMTLLSLNEVILKREEPLPVESIKGILATIATGLLEASKGDLGHFFMTPDFLFLNEQGAPRVAGIGLFQSIQYEAFERFVSGAVVPIIVEKGRNFTAIEILSPEIRNFKARDQRSDFYCIGMTAYFMLAGCKPERKWRLPSEVRPGIKEGWDLLISQCLEPRPVDRFPHFRSFLRDLENVEGLSGSSRREGGQLRRRLNRIPLPKAIESIVPLRYHLFTRLALLGLAGIMAIGTASLFHQIIYSDIDVPDQSPPIRQVFREERANFIVRVEPPNAWVDVRGPESGRFVLSGDDLYLHGRPGAYSVEVTAPRRRAEKFDVIVSSTDPVELSVLLNYEFVTVRFEGEIGTDIYALPEPDFPVYVGTIDSTDGLQMENRLLRGDYTFLAVHPAYLPSESEPVSIGFAGRGISFEQVSRPTRLVVSSEPANAVVTVNGVKVGLTPLSIEKLEIGVPLRVEVNKQGYRAASQVFEFSKGQSHTFSVGDLEKRRGHVLLNLELSGEDTPDLTDFRLSVDGKASAASLDQSIELTEGSHELVLEHPDYFPLKTRVEVADREDREVAVKPKSRPMRILPVLEGAQTARFRVGEVATTLDKDGSLLVPSGVPVPVEAMVRDYHNVTQWFEGKANEEIEWKIPLRRLSGPEKGDDYSPPYFDLQMSWVDPARFSMGSPVSEFRRLPNEDNLTLVKLDYGFWIGVQEVDQKTYLHVMGENPSRFEGDNRPVDSVSWTDASEFCERLTQFERQASRLPKGYVYRLPTEAEWEMAARAGTTTAFSFGDEGDPTIGNFHGFYSPSESFGKSSEERYGTLPVKSFQPNALGLYDVHGNVAEWTLDRYWDRLPGGVVTNPYNGDRGRGYVLRGGSWKDSADRVRTAAREGAPTGTSRNSIGFRVALAPSPESLGK